MTPVGDPPATTRPWTLGPKGPREARATKTAAGGVLIVCAAGRPGLQNPARPGQAGRVVTPPARPMSAATAVRPEYMTGSAAIVSGPPPTQTTKFGSIAALVVKTVTSDMSALFSV